MDIFVRQVPQHATDKQLRDFFRGPLSEFGILVYHCEKIPSKRCAVLTVPETHLAQRFLELYGIPNDADQRARARKPLRMLNSYLKCSKSRNEPSDFTLRSIVFEQAQRVNKGVSNKSSHRGNITTFAISEFLCGDWEYVGHSLTFVSQYRIRTNGTVTFGLKQAVLSLDGRCRVDMNYYGVDHVVSGSYEDPSVTFTLTTPPKVYDIANAVNLEALIAALNVSDLPKKSKKVRMISIDASHAEVADTCFVYRLRLADYTAMSTVYELLKRLQKLPQVVTHATRVIVPSEPLRTTHLRLENELSDTMRFGSLPFHVRFQVKRLAQNGILPPHIVLQLLPTISGLVRLHGDNAAAEAIRDLYRQVPVPGPSTVSTDYAIATLKTSLENSAVSYSTNASGSRRELIRRHKHLTLIHKVTVTPMGTYLEGPEPEVSNRVLRQYQGHTDHFIRVTFIDEDGEAVRYDPHADQQSIFYVRFLEVLDGTILIAGRGFSFLGHSHSSQRSQTCWFMAPFGIMHAPLVIKQLGDFRHIRSPAKCAARIGQTFTDTSGTIAIAQSSFGILEEIERNGRTFSDGVGTISAALLKKIWKVYGTRRSLKPTLLQIRFAGAKGMVSLDRRLTGERLMLRESMIKFEGSKSWDVEICGAAFRPLPMILNRQLIKILEDLGVEDDTFLQLQQRAVENLRCYTTSSINASNFLENECLLTKAAQLPNLIRLMGYIGLDFRDDDFLSGIVEMAVVTKLRDLKYRGRIPIERGITLFGIMDETGILQEGQVYVVTEKAPNGGRHVLTGPVMVTRSPALHPGDVQKAMAMDVPDNSPLNALSNCVVFSQHGNRDLPSQLSGGDLDGDLYNVIYDPCLMPKFTCEPADYSRPLPIDIGREVVSRDMTSFFVKFMESDQLGQICNIHLQLADQKSEGTLDEDCKKLASMASTAVDFSKTGIPVDFSECPRYPRARPDFMAPSPRIVISDGTWRTIDEGYQDDEDDPVTALDPDFRRMRYYKSDKILGQLYRAIDEQQFLVDLQKQRGHVSFGPNSSLIGAIWDYVRRENLLVQWEHHRQLAREIKEAFEHNLHHALYEYSPVLHQPISEHEIFSGTILGRKGGAQNRRIREICTKMRENFEEVVAFTIDGITKGDGEDDRDQEALPRAMACLAIGVEEPGLWDHRVGELKSWRYVAAAVCMREMERWRHGLELHAMLPPA